MRKLHAAVSLLLILASLSGCSEKDAVTTEEPDTGSAIVTEEETQTETTEEETRRTAQKQREIQQLHKTQRRSRFLEDRVSHI